MSQQKCFPLLGGKLVQGPPDADGQFNVVWKTKGPVRAQPWSQYIPGNEKKPDTPAKSM
jgi:urea transport system substrate-binding protein